MFALCNGFHCLGKELLTLGLGERLAIRSLAHQHGNLFYNAPGGRANFYRIETDLGVFHGRVQAPDAAAAGIGALQLVEDSLPDDAGKGDPPRAWLEVFGHTIGFQALILPVPAPIPVIKQGGQRLIAGRCDGLRRIVDLIKTVGVGGIVLGEKPLGQLPERLIHFGCALLHIPGRQAHLIRQRFTEGGKEDFFGGGHKLTVFVRPLGQGLLMVCFHLFCGPHPLGDAVKCCVQVRGKTTDHGVADAKNAIRNQRPFAGQFQLADVGKVFLVDKGHCKHIVLLAEPVAAVNPLLHL